MPQQVPEKINQPDIKDLVKNIVSDNTTPKLEKVPIGPEIHIEEYVKISYFERLKFILNQDGERIFGITVKLADLLIKGGSSAIVGSLRSVIEVLNLILSPINKQVPQINKEDFMPSDVGTAEAIKGFVVPMIVRWLLKVGGGALAAHGISEGSVNEVVGALVMVLIGVVVSLINHKKAIATTPPGQ